MKNTVLEIKTNTFLENIEKIKKYVGNKEIMPVVKANAYGTYINKNLEILNHFSIIAVAEVQEAIEIRKLGYEKEIMVINQPAIEEIKDINQYNITIGLSEIEFLKRVNLPIKVHLEIETGMNRTGIQLKNLEDYLKLVKNNFNITVEGIYTHFSSADESAEYTEKQLNNFIRAINIVKKEFTLKYIHCSASNGIMKAPESITNLVRPGIIMYGYESFLGAKDIISIQPIATLKTKITYIKNIEAGEYISYNRKYQTPKPMTIATIPIGYADGLRRSLSNKGEVIVQGEKRKILGNICMDSCMIDVTNLNVEVGDTVYIWDNQTITLEDVAKQCDTINYEILSTLSNRIERKFID